MIALRFSIGVCLIVALTACGSSNPAPTTPTPTTPTTPSAVTVTIVPAARTLGTAAFTPNPAAVAANGKLTWSNTDTVTHDMVSDSGIWDSGRISPGDHFDFTFPTKGTFPYHCSIHAGMTGSIVVQ
jgi:plastocyanin